MIKRQYGYQEASFVFGEAAESDLLWQPEFVITRRKKPDWSSLPGEILEVALAQLLLSEVFQPRSMCKRWNTLNYCKHFQERTRRNGLLWGPCHSPRVSWNGKAQATRIVR